MRRRGTRLALVLMGGLAAALGTSETRAQGTEAASTAAVHVGARDAVARLLQRIAVGEVTLAGSDREILRAVLRELHVPAESQMTVFSRTSMQAGLIRPHTPRALYFSETTYVGWVPGGLIEAIAIDPEKGPNFYAFDPQDARDKRRTFVRETSCRRCHGSAAMEGEQNPPLFARSVVATEQGEPLREQGSDLVTDKMPFERRWGGWYVTGYDGKPSHRGNAFGREREGQVEFDASDQRPAELSGFFDTSRYLAATSDVVALLVFEHQLAIHNSFFRARQVAARARDGAAQDAEVTAAIDDVLDHLLFRDAAPLPEGVIGNEAFRRAFASDAPRSGGGDALKDFSRRGRLFANRCSYLIYSEAFTTLPAGFRELIFARLGAILRDERQDTRYGYLEPDEKRRIRDILRDTIPEARKHFTEQGHSFSGR